MPKGHWGHGPRQFITERMWLFPALEQTPDISRGESRLAAEVALAELQGVHVPTFAHERAVSALQVLAKG